MIKTTIDGHVLRIGLARPEKRNAFTTAMLGELAAAYTRLDEDPELRVGLLYAEGDHFTGGLDLAEVGPAVARGAALFEGGVDPLGVTGRHCRKPVVAAAQGICFTIGIELMLAADVALCADDTRFAQMEVRRGIMAFGGATLRMPQASWSRAMRWLLTGDEFPPDEALALGLVSEVVARAELMDRASAIAHTIASRAPLAVQATLRSARLAREAALGPARDALMAEARALFSTEDAAEGVRSFVERREGRFTGR